MDNVALLIIKFYDMELKMKLDGRMVDSIQAYVPACNDEKYLTWLKTELCLKHRHLLLQGQTDPLFYLEEQRSTEA